MDATRTIEESSLNDAIAIGMSKRNWTEAEREIVLLYLRIAPDLFLQLLAGCDTLRWIPGSVIEELLKDDPKGRLRGILRNAILVPTRRGKTPHVQSLAVIPMTVRQEYATIIRDTLNRIMDNEHYPLAATRSVAAACDRFLEGIDK